MTVVLSVILDITNADWNGQAFLSSKEIWDIIQTRLSKKCKVKLTPLEPFIREKWEYINAKSVEKGDPLSARRYLDQLWTSKNVPTVEYNTCRFLDLIFDTIQNCQHVLNPLYPDNIPEGDLTFTIWMPLFRRLFDINSNIIRLKPNKSVSDDSTNEKVYIYSDSHINLIGFKVDLRFLYGFEEVFFRI